MEDMDMDECSGYLNNPETTAASLDSEKWLHTGDLGYVDTNGYLFIVDRLKEMIKYKAHQVYRYTYLSVFKRFFSIPVKISSVVHLKSTHLSTPIFPWAQTCI